MHALNRVMPDVPCRVGNRAALPTEELVENAARFSTLGSPSVRQHGFTLVELVLVIALSAVVAVMVSSVLSRPLEGFTAQSRRAELVDVGTVALNRMQRDIRMAVPGSLRVSPDNQGLELLQIDTAGRYLANRQGGRLAFASRDPDAELPEKCIDGETSDLELAACDVLQVLDPNFTLPASAWLALPNTGADLWNDAASPGALLRAKITPLGVVDGISRFHITPEAGNFEFAAPSSSSRRLYFATRVVGYRCVGNQLLRYEQEQLPSAWPGPLPSVAHVQAGHVNSCSFQAYSEASQATLRLNIAQTDEAIRLVQFVQVNNAP